MFNIGEIVFDIEKNEKVKIIECIELWGFISYKVLNIETNQVYKVANTQVKRIESNQYNEFYVRYITNLAKIKNTISQGRLASINSSIIPLPHQLHVLNRVMSTENIRYILADEVGLGKTIEAGLIIKELKARGLVKRILVVCPTGLVTQWGIEMKEKFDETFHTIIPADYESIKKITGNDDVYGQFDQVISPMDSIKPLEKRAGWSKEKINKYNQDRIYAIINSGWDLIIIDEAHRVAGSSTEVSRYKLGNLLGNSSPYLLLLTATPHSGKTEPFLRLIRLLDEKAFPNSNAIVKEQVAPYVIRTEKREAIDNKGNRLFRNRVTKVVEIKWDERHTLQRELYERVTEYVKTNYNKAIKEKKFYIGFLMVLMQRLVTSSTHAIKDSMEKRIDILENQEAKINSLSMIDLVEMDLEGSLDKAVEAISMNIKKELIQLSDILGIAKQAQFEYLDAKAEVLRNILDDLYTEDREQKVIIFTEFVATQNFLSEYLQNNNYKVSLLNGSKNIEERNVLLNEFRDKTDILISTDAGGEGLNLQFSNIVINYDLPWNPMKIEQRIGRVDRIGQKKDVQVFNFILKDTIENRVRNILEDKLSVILSETGIDKIADVLDNEMTELDFSEAYINSIKAPQNIQNNIKKIELDIKDQINMSNKYKELIKEEKNLESDINYNMKFNLNDLIKNMLISYDEWKEKDTLIESFNIKDVLVKEHLDKEIEVLSVDEIPFIRIKNLPNENGYFMLWELNINEEIKYREIIPIFVNSSMVIRPLAGKKIWDVFLDEKTEFDVVRNRNLGSTELNILREQAMSIMYDKFKELEKSYEINIADELKRYLYAVNLRLEATNQIGIENIKKSKNKKLLKERQEIIDKYQKNKSIVPNLKALFIAYLEE